MKICAIDTETTNIDFMKAEAVEVSIVPLLNNFEVDESIKSFSVLVNPGEEALDLGNEALAFNKIGKDTIMKDGIPSKSFTPFLEGWMYANGIDVILPLAHNWVYDRVILHKLMGVEKVEKLIFRRAKDSHTAAVFINDVYEAKGEPKPFKRTNLSSLAEYFGISSEGAHRAEADCVMTAAVYKNLLEMLGEE